jgi:hypothetical protein
MNAITADMRMQRDVIAAIEAELREAKATLAGLENEALEIMENQGLTRISASGLTLGIKTSIVPQLKNYAEFEPYVYRNEALHLLERRIHTIAWREELLRRDNTPVPGIEPWTKVRLSVTTD